MGDCNVSWDRPIPENACFQEWLATGQGAFGEGGPKFIFTFRSSVSENDDADMMVFANPGGVFKGFYPGYGNDLPTARSFSWTSLKMQPGNTAGTVTLRSANPRDTPLINFNFFQEKGKRDLTAIRETAELVLKTLNAAGEPWTPVQVVEPVPGIDTEQAMMDRSFSHHASSTCRMGPKGHPDYCVDNEFKVNGVDSLRVVDASVFPRTPGAFPVAPTFVLSQKLFRVIEAGWNKE